MTDTLETTRQLPVADWVDAAQLRLDPYPTYARLRDESPVAWVPAVDKVLVSTFDACAEAERHPEVFSSHVEGAHMIRAMGARPMIRKDDPEHADERRTINPALRPKAITQHFIARFERNTAACLDAFEAVGPESADLNRDFAAPLASMNLADLIGFRDVDPVDLARWSLDFIAGSGNVHEDESIWARCDRSRAEVTAALDDLLPTLARTPDHSIASLLQQGGMPDESVRANIMLTISGGMNEPQHVMTAMALLLDEHPGVRPSSGADVDAHEAWLAVFNEAVRVYTPIGMVTRQTAADAELEGVHIPSGSQVGLLLASANRDERVFEAADAFRPGRPERRHLGFGSGPHVCAGKWAAEASVARIAMPALYARFGSLAVDRSREITWNGFAFRGLTALPVTWAQ